MKAFTDHFCHLFGEVHTSISVDWANLYPDTNWHLEDLNVPFTEAEIKEAIFSLGADKALGPDSFSLFFFQIFWNTIKTDLLALFYYLHNSTMQIKRLSYALITLIPKVKGASTISKF